MRSTAVHITVRRFVHMHGIIQQGGKGVSIALDNVMKVKDGEAFSGKVDAADDFASFGVNGTDDSDMLA